MQEAEPGGRVSDIAEALDAFFTRGVQVQALYCHQGNQWVTIHEIVIPNFFPTLSPHKRQQGFFAFWLSAWYYPHAKSLPLTVIQYCVLWALQLALRTTTKWAC